ncbi:hypothetical protein GA0074696_6149 [Micromonospora purpureochromogenes]|uniref:Uncharacterized protein n=1 Tax=Micromonospora purpureochromogenes TaxID=47872 RepID=A0A1C4U083_9ACTN|nr:hypothetical protein [Micromonospora purpureochromogenes]SCE65112.1 hypothetical protein GA0074696_0005 [Micromonospora purpureochromogenes]SCF45266.1 hypothetical protein GA0074696_6149 [Micromonospora purpureochromogenes]
MSVDQETATDDEPPPADEVSTATLVGYTAAALALVAWFLFGWLVQRQGFVASGGETAGAAFALLLAVSVIGTVRRSRR